MKVNPYNKREEADKKKAFASTKRTVSEVAKDTNKTRRKETRERIVGDTAPNTKPRTDLKKDMKKSMRGKC
jgi:hypothetical protein